MFLAYRERMARRDEGFTLIELLIVIVIIGILAAIAIPTFLNQRNRAFRSAMQSDLRNMAAEVETFYVDNQTYVGFLATTTWTGRAANESRGVDLSADAAHFTVSAYCMSAVHANIAGETWVIRNGNRLGQVGVGGVTACP